MELIPILNARVLLENAGAAVEEEEHRLAVRINGGFPSFIYKRGFINRSVSLRAVRILVKKAKAK